MTKKAQVSLLRHFIASIWVILLGIGASVPGSAMSGDPIVSGSLASDEILLALAMQTDPSCALPYLALSPLVDNPDYSSSTNNAKKHPLRWKSNVESLLAMHPKLVILASYNNPMIKSRLLEAKVPTIELKDFNSLADIGRNILSIGEAVGCKQSAIALRKQFDTNLQSIASEQKGSKKRPSLISFSSAGMPGGKNTLIDEMIRSAGGTNLPADKGLVGWSKLSDEVLISSQPDFIIVSSKDDIERAKKNPLWNHMKAVKEQHYIVVPSALLTSVSHHIVEAIQLIAAGIHSSPSMHPPRKK